MERGPTERDYRNRNPAMKIYIGDGAYAEFDGYSIILTTENGISIQNRIVLEPEVWMNLERWVNTNLKEKTN